MILHLKNGQLYPKPTDPVLAHKRAQRLAAECQRIEAQLNDRQRMAAISQTGADAYADWRRRAEQALRMHNMELRLLNEWLEQQRAGLLRKARNLFVTLIEDGCDFDEEELEFINELKSFVDNAGNSVG
jgi:hypothetical protein